MNRVIKFRAWDNERKEMLQWTVIWNWKFETVFRNDYSFMQFTGLTDKKGNEIYEGDILQCHNMLIEIIYSANAFVGKFRHIKDDPSESLNNRNYLQWTVIGNIYESPNLIK